MHLINDTFTIVMEYIDKKLYKKFTMLCKDFLEIGRKCNTFKKPIIKYRKDNNNLLHNIHFSETNYYMFKYLIEYKKFSPHKRKNRLFKLACEHNKYKLVEYLLTFKKVNPKAGNSYGLYIATHKNYTRLIKLLIADGRSDMSSDNYRILCELIKFNHYDIIKSQIKQYYTNVNSYQSNKILLNTAIEYKRYEIIELLNKKRTRAIRYY
jgi:hypothetical protein